MKIVLWVKNLQVLNFLILYKFRTQKIFKQGLTIKQGIG